MQDLDLLELIEKLTASSHLHKIADTFASQICLACELENVFVYLHDPRHNLLSPIGCSSSKLANQIKSVSLYEVDNPLVYALMNNRTCFVENISTLIDIGNAFEELKLYMSFNDALLATPLQSNTQTKHSYAIMLSHGHKRNIEQLQKNATWMKLITIFGQLIAIACEFKNEIPPAQVRQVYAYEYFENKTRELSTQFISSEYVGESPHATETRALILKVAPTSLSILLTGETGVGKDYVASLIHKASSRTNGKFVAINCAAIPSGLIEAELFGNVKGAFTGAFERQGLVAAAHKGTLFLDEIGDMPLDMQASLLRLLNEKKYRPVGSNEERPSDFRLIYATNKDLLKLIQNNTFREDLYYRIRQEVIEVSPLRERRTDIQALCFFFITQFYLHFSKRISGLEQDALSMLSQHDFPGNLRELKNYLYAACEYTEHNQNISAQNILTKTKQNVENRKSNHSPKIHLEQSEFDQIISTDNLVVTLENMERRIISTRLSQYSGSRNKTAQSLSIPLRTLSRKCQQWKL